MGPKWVWVALAVGLAGTAAASETALPDTVYKLDEMVVVGTRVLDTRKELPVSVSVISGEAVRASATVGDAISVRVPGAFVTQRGLLSYGTGPGSAGKLTLRGVGNSMTNSQVLVLVDGRPDFMGIFGHPLMDAYRTDDVARIEVVRGPASALYGTNAMGGAVNIVTRQYRNEGIRSSAGFSLGSHDTREYTAGVNGRQGRGHGGLAVSRRQTDGHRPHSAYETTNLSARLGAQVHPAWSVSAGGYLADFYSEEPGTVFAPTPGHFADIVRSGMDVTLAHRHSRGSGMAKLHGTFGKHKLGDGFRSTDRILGLVFFEAFQPREGAKLSAGFDVKRYGGKSRNETQGADFGSHWVTEAAPHAHIQQVVARRVILSGGLRREHHSLFGGVWIPQGGIVVQPDDRVSLRAAVARGFHSPTIRDLYLPFPAANPDLQPERLWSVEGGGEVRLGDRLRLDLAVYRQTGEGSIQPAFGPGGPRLINGGKFTSYGAEFSSRVRLAAGLYGDLTYAYFSAPETASGTPGHSLAIVLTYTHGPFQTLVTGTQVRDLYGLSGMPAVAGRLENYGVVDVRAACRLRPWMQAYVQADNLFDNAYQTQPGYPMPGATVRAGLTLTLDRTVR